MNDAPLTLYCQKSRANRSKEKAIEKARATPIGINQGPPAWNDPIKPVSMLPCCASIFALLAKRGFPMKPRYLSYETRITDLTEGSSNVSGQSSRCKASGT